MSRTIRYAGPSHFVLNCLLLASLAASAFAAGPSVEPTGTLSAPGTSAELTKAVEDKGYRVSLEDGWTAEFWFARALAITSKESPGALYPELTNGEFVAVVNYSKGASDFRGQAIPAGLYTLRYQYLPQDANHMGVSPNPDFLLAIPIVADTNPSHNLPFQPLVKLSAKTTGTAHPAVIALATAGTPESVAPSEGVTVFTVAVPTGGSSTKKIGIVVKGQASQ